MKNLTVTNLDKKFAGHGHFRIYAEINEQLYSTITDDMPMIDAAFDEDDEDFEEERINLVATICRANEIDYSNIEIM